jgi:hypothetical protein
MSALRLIPHQQIVAVYHALGNAFSLDETIQKVRDYTAMPAPREGADGARPPASEFCFSASAAPFLALEECQVAEHDFMIKIISSNANMPRLKLK